MDVAQFGRFVKGYMLWFGITNAPIYGLHYTNTLSNIFFQSDNISISKMIVDKTVDNYALRSSKMGCNELYPLMSQCPISSKPYRSIGGYMYYRLYVI